jgi:hypothetical protein
MKKIKREQQMGRHRWIPKMKRDTFLNRRIKKNEKINKQI